LKGTLNGVVKLNLLMITTPGAPATPGGRPPDRVPTPQCLFRADIKTGTAVAPAGSVGGSIEDEIFAILWGAPLNSVEFEEGLDRLFTYDSVTRTDIKTGTAVATAGSVGGSIEDEILAALCGAPLKSVEFEDALDRIFTYDTVTPAALTPMAPRDVFGAQVPTNSTTAYPVDHVVREQGGRDDRDASGRPYYASRPLARAVLSTDFRIPDDPLLRSGGRLCVQGRRQPGVCRSWPKYPGPRFCT